MKGFKMLSLIIEVTDSCNLNCRFCYNKERRTARYMKPESLKQILKKHNPLFLQLTGGEITTHPDLKAILAIGIKKSLKMQISTNGLALNKIIEIVKHYKNKPIISISLDAAGNQHDRLRGSIGLYNKIITGIEENKKHKIPFAFNSTIFDREVITDFHGGNLNQVERLISIAEKLKVPINFQPYAPTTTHLRQSLGRILLKSDSKYILNTLSYRKMLIDGHNGKCRFLFSNLSIGADGGILSTKANSCYFCKDCLKCYYSCVWEPSLATSKYFLLSIASFLLRNTGIQILRESILRRYERDGKNAG